MVRMDAFSDFDQYRQSGAPALTTWDFEGHGVRSILIDGEPWFVAKDVAIILGLDTAAVGRTVEDEDKGLHTVQTPSGPQQMVTINESGLYCMIFKSRKSAAKKFKRWVTAEVLPTIRKTGGYGNALGSGSAVPAHALAESLKLTSRELNAYARVVAEARRIAGRSSAVVVWVQTPLPTLPDRRPDLPPPAIALDPPRRTFDGIACLRRLLSCPITRRPGLTLADMMRIAKSDAATRNGLVKIGIMVDPANWRGWVAVSANHRSLQRAFLDSPWAADWPEALAAIRGARLGHDIDGFGHNRRAVLIPWDRIAAILDDR